MLGWENVDAHNGWLIFKTGPSELGVHPTDGATTHHEISLLCDDLHATMTDLSARGAEFEGAVEDRRFGRSVALKVPGAGVILLYEPSHPTVFDL